MFKYYIYIYYVYMCVTCLWCISVWDPRKLSLLQKKNRSISVWNRPIIMSGLALKLRGTPENLMVNRGESMVSITGPCWLLVCIDIPCQKPYCHRAMVEAETLKKEVEHCVATACGKTAAWTQGWPSKPSFCCLKLDSHTPGNGTTPVAGHWTCIPVGSSWTYYVGNSSGILHL